MKFIEMVKKDVQSDEAFCFQTTPLSKIIVLSLATLGFYFIILTYGYWRSLKEKFGYKISPFWRAIFVAFTNFRLYPVFGKYFNKHNIPMMAGGTLASIYFILNYISNKLGISYIEAETTDWTAEFASLLLLAVLIAITAAIQHKINKINEEHYPDAVKNNWKVSNIIWAIVCTILNIICYLPK